MFSMVPAMPATLTPSPTWNGRSTKFVIAANMFASVGWSAAVVPIISLGLVPFDQQLPAFCLAQQRQLGNPLIGIGYDCFQQNLEMLQHPPNGPAAKKARAVGRPAERSVFCYRHVHFQVKARSERPNAPIAHLQLAGR